MISRKGGDEMPQDEAERVLDQLETMCVEMSDAQRPYIFDRKRMRDYLDKISDTQYSVTQPPDEGKDAPCIPGDRLWDVTA